MCIDCIDVLVVFQNATSMYRHVQACANMYPFNITPLKELTEFSSTNNVQASSEEKHLKPKP